MTQMFTTHTIEAVRTMGGVGCRIAVRGSVLAAVCAGLMLTAGCNNVGRNAAVGAAGGAAGSATAAAIRGDDVMESAAVGAASGAAAGVAAGFVASLF